MPSQLNRIAKYTTEREFDLLRDILSKDIRDLDRSVLRKRVPVLRRHSDKARERAISEARKGQSGELSRRKAEIFRDALRRCERRLLEIEVKEAREAHKAAARKALEKKKRSNKTGKSRLGSKSASKGMPAKPRSKAVPRLTAGREKGHVLGTQRRGQAKRDSR